MSSNARTAGYSLLICLRALAAAPSAHAAIELDVEPTMVTVGQPVLIFGSSDCEGVTLDFGDATLIASFAGPGPFIATHVYTEPGVRLVLVLGTACADGIDSQVSTVVVNAGAGGAPVPPEAPGVPGAPSASLFIERVNLHFENDRPQIRVPQNRKGLQVFAQIQYRGTGLLQGYWEVDGVVWSFVNRHLVFGQTATIASAQVPGLPTIEPGVHRVRLVLTRPGAGFTPPLALYFAGYTPEPGSTLLRLVRPLRGSHLSYEGKAFEWAVAGNADHYGVSFFAAESREAVFRALTRRSGYELLGRVLEQHFAPGGRYQWQVVAYDANGDEVGRSSRSTFEVQVPAALVRRQPLVMTGTP